MGEGDIVCYIVVCHRAYCISSAVAIPTRCTVNVNVLLFVTANTISLIQVCSFRGGSRDGELGG